MSSACAIPTHSNEIQLTVTIAAATTAAFMSRVLREGEEDKQEEEEVSGGPSKSNGGLALEQLRTQAHQI